MTVPPDPDLYQALDDAFDLLDPVERRILAMIYFGGQTQDQVARRMLVSRPAVSRAVSRAMTRLAQVLEG